MTLRRQLAVKLSHFPCSIPETGTYNWAWIVYKEATFVRLDDIVNANGTDGNPVPAIIDPGPPAAGNHAQTEIWKYTKGLYNNYKMIKTVKRETMSWAFPRGGIFLDLRDQTGHLFQDPVPLFRYI